MGIEIKLYKFGKKRNSTAQPNTPGLIYSCNLIDDCSICNPKIAFLLPTNAHNLVDYNYAYIPDFKRFYYVENWTYSNRRWVCDLTVDVLASWKTEIGESEQYILRSSNLDVYNPFIVDGKYISEIRPHIHMTNATTNDFVNNIKAGCYIVTAISNAAMSNIDMTTGWVLTRQEYMQLSQELYADEGFISELLNGVKDPLSKIIRCYWLPVSAEQIPGTIQNTMYVGKYSVNVSCKRLENPSGVVNFSMSFKNVEHPDSAARGTFLNYSPYTRRTFYWQPLGTVPLDTAKIGNLGTIDVSFSIDLRDGSAVYKISSGANLVEQGSCNIGVDIALSQTSVDTIRLTTSVLSTMASGASGNYLGALGGCLSAVTSSLPQMKVSGGGGGAASYVYKLPYICHEFTTLSEENLSMFGRPVFSTKKVCDLCGYMEVQSPVLTMLCTDHEKADIIAYMTGGFYYE